MRSDTALKVRLTEIRASRKAGEITSEQAAVLRHEAFAARKQVREESEFSGTGRPQVWEGESLAQRNPLGDLFFQCVGVLCRILQTPVRDADTGMPQIRELPSVSKADKQANKGPAKGWNGGKFLPAHHHVLFAILRKRDGEGVHKHKREVYNLAKCENPLAAVTQRARALEASGWSCAILRTPESDNLDSLPERIEQCERMNETRLTAEISKRLAKGGNTPKAGWNTKHQTFAHPDGRIMRPEELAPFAQVFPRCSPVADRETVQEVKDCRGINSHCQWLRDNVLGARESLTNIDLPVGEKEGAITFVVMLNGLLVTGEEQDPDDPVAVRDVVTRTIDIRQHPKGDLVDADGKPIPGTGARLRAEQLCLETTMGPNGCLSPVSVTYECPESGETITVTRESLLNPGGYGETTADGRKRKLAAPTAMPLTVDPEESETTMGFGDEPMDLCEWLELDPNERVMMSRTELPRKRVKFAVHWERQTNTSGPWQKAKDSAKGGTYDRMARAQGL